MTNAMLWLGSALVFALACNLKDPLFLPLRAWETPGLVLLGLAGGALALRGRQSLRYPCAALWLIGALIAIAGEMRFQMQRHAILDAGSSRIGQHFILGYDRLEKIEPLVARGLVGGVFISRRNVVGRTADEIAAEIAHLQGLRRAAGLPPLLVAADQEGGMVSRLSPPAPPQPPLASLSDLPVAERDAAVRAYATAQGRALAALGITVNFAPVVDLRVEHGYNPLDRHSLIARRAIAADADTVTAVALVYAQALTSAGVTPTVKHFPGLGRLWTDTHYLRARLETPMAELAATDWRPFRAMAAGSDAFMMLGHVVLPAIDAKRPVSHSKAEVQTVLRQAWGFDGVLVTDDLTMGAIHRHGLCDAVVEALNAGVDLLLIAYDGDLFVPAMVCALAAERQGRLDTDMLARGAWRLEIDRQRRVR